MMEVSYCKEILNEIANEVASLKQCVHGLEALSDKAKFTQKVGELLRIAKPNLISCKLATGAQIIADCDNEYYFRQLHKEVLPEIYSEYVVITCENGYQYFVNVTANSLAAIASAVFEYTMYK